MPSINVCLVVKLSTVSIPHAESYINVHRKHFACREQIAIAGGVYYVVIEEREVPKSELLFQPTNFLRYCIVIRCDGI
jgi:hypothetical protein